MTAPIPAAADLELPRIDEHAIAIAAPRVAVWAALERLVDGTLAAPGGALLGRLLGADPPGGFAVIERVHTRRIALAGRHRFARYRLIFVLDAAPDGRTLLRAITLAEFPGLRGRVYRALVIGTRLHVLATRGILHRVRRRACAR